MAEKEGGWVKQYRSIWDWRSSPIKEKRPFTKFEAWSWLIQAASYQDHICGSIPVKRGQVLTSQVKLAKLWKRDRKTVRAWQRDFQKHGEIWSARGQSWSLITICEYEEYQGDSPPNSPPDSPPNSPSNSPPDSPQSRRGRKEKKGKKAATDKSAKPKQSNIEEFDEWWNSNKPKVKEILLSVTAQTAVTPFLAKWLSGTKEEKYRGGHYGEMRSWFVADSTRRKVKFGRFVRNWLKDEWKKHKNKGDGTGMTATEEKDHFASKRRTDSGSGMTSISETIKEAEDD